jgi:hypothetical protein
MNTAVELILVTLLASLVNQPAPSPAPVSAECERRDRRQRDR